MPKRRKTRRHGRKPREKGAEEEPGEGARWRTEEGKGTNAVGGSWRRNDYRPRTHSLPAIISSTNAAKSIGAESPKNLLSQIPRLDTPIPSALFRDYVLFKFKCRVLFKFKCPVLSLSLSRLACRQKFRIAYILIDTAIFIESLIVRFHTDT